MENSLYIMTSAKKALRRRMDVVANNIANMNTPAFKADKSLFRQVMTRQNDNYNEFYVANQGTFIDFAEGVFTPTANQFDVALGDEGFLVVETPQGVRYTRSGRMQLNAERQLVTASGDLIQGTAGPIVIPQNAPEILINQDGSITADGQNIATLQVVRFEDPMALRKTINNMFTTDQEPIVVENPSVRQGMLEGSNVQAIAEVTEMMSILRTYQSIGRVEKLEDDRINKMIQAYKTSR